MDSKKTNNKVKLSNTRWAYVKKEYKLVEFLGEGSFGQVVRAKHRVSGKVFAIKMITDVFKHDYQAKKILREIEIMT